MTTYVVFLRGINVGGHNKIPMLKLRELCSELGFLNPQTVLASGNLVFQHQPERPTTLRQQLRSGISERFHLDIDLVVLEGHTFLEILQDDPLSHEGRRSDWLTVMFFQTPPTSEEWEKALTRHQGPEHVEIGSRAAYIYYTEGMGRSKLNLGAEIHRTGTVRNRNTLNKVKELLG